MSISMLRLSAGLSEEHLVARLHAGADDHVLVVARAAVDDHLAGPVAALHVDDRLAVVVEDRLHRRIGDALELVDEDLGVRRQAGTQAGIGVDDVDDDVLSLIHISEPTRLLSISYA